MNALNKFISDIRKRYSEEQIRKMFISKRHDQLFETVGKKAMPSFALKTTPAHIPVWRGYELVMGINKDQ